METPQITPLRPTQHAKHHLIVSILNGTHPPGSNLPSERILAQQLGVTRPTLRETLQRLASEKWITIRHGKPTKVNHFWDEGGLSMLGTLAKYGDYLPNGFILHLLELRATLLPAFARLAAKAAPQKLLDHLSQSDRLAANADAYAHYDWNLQTIMARHSGNPIYILILNDFASIFRTMALQYFNHEKARQASQNFYLDLANSIRTDSDSVEHIVSTAMAQSIVIWEEIDPLRVMTFQHRLPEARNGALERLG